VVSNIQGRILCFDDAEAGFSVRQVQIVVANTATIIGLPSRDESVIDLLGSG
jgi:hypothetical protein